MENGKWRVSIAFLKTGAYWLREETVTENHGSQKCVRVLAMGNSLSVTSDMPLTAQDSILRPRI